MLSIWFRRLGGAWVPGCLQSWRLRTVNYNCTCPTHLSAGCIPVLRGDRQQARSARQANCFTLWLVRTSNTYHVQIQRRLFDILLLHNCRLKIVENHVDPRLVCFPNHLLVGGLCKWILIAECRTSHAFQMQTIIIWIKYLFDHWRINFPVWRNLQTFWNRIFINQTKMFFVQRRLQRSVTSLWHSKWNRQLE